MAVPAMRGCGGRQKPISCQQPVECVEERPCDEVIDCTKQSVSDTKEIDLVENKNVEQSPNFEPMVAEESNLEEVDEQDLEYEEPEEYSQEEEQEYNDEDQDQDQDEESEFNEQDGSKEEENLESSKMENEEKENNLEEMKQEEEEEKEEGFKEVLFDFNGKNIKEDQEEVLKNNLAKIKQLALDGHKIVIEGHACHSAGTEDYNLKISRQRAEAVANYLIKNGIEKDSIQILAHGSKMPIVEEGSKEEQALNRRVEIYAYKEA